MSRAFLVHAFGGPEVLTLEQRDVGAPGPGEIKLAHKAIGLNFVDTYQRTGLYKLPLPFVPGNEAAGVVTAVGAGVSEFKPGDRVAYSGLVGAYADERLLPADKAVHVPDGISDEQAAAALLKGTTAYYLLHDTYALAAGETALIHAAAGGTGSILVQWAKAIGARVIGTAGGAEKLALVKALGADAVIDYKADDFPARVRELTGGKGVDVVYDGVGQATFEGSLKSLRPRGMMVSFGNASGPVSIPRLGILADLGSLYLTRPTSGSYFNDDTPHYRHAAKSLFDAMLDGRITVGIQQRYRLDQAIDAHKALEARETTGSSVLLP